MEITVLVENTRSRDDIIAEHGLSLFIRACGRNVLFDAGQTDAVIDNAAALGIDLADADFAVISHGHYDHTGGLSAFRAANPNAPVYIRENAFGMFMHADKYIGVPAASREIGGIIPVRCNMTVEPGFYLITGVEPIHALPHGNEELTVCTDAGICRDGFLHEQDFAVEEGGRLTLFTGCAHCGVMNIMDAFRAEFGRYPDTVVGGFHLMKETDETVLRETAEELLSTGAMFLTGHCTGQNAFDVLKSVMGERIVQFSAGNTLFA